MIEKRWVHESRKTLVCIDSYHKGIPEGRIYNAYADSESFESLSQFLIKMEAMLDELQLPQSYTATRSFGLTENIPDNGLPVSNVRKGRKATFEVQVIFRQHTSWQGTVIWLDEQMEQSFRSVLELIILMDSALRKLEGYDGA